jgi:hypothetical protein
MAADDSFAKKFFFFSPYWLLLFFVSFCVSDETNAASLITKKNMFYVAIH